MAVHQPPPGVNPAGYRSDIRAHLLDILRGADRPLDTVELAHVAGVPRDKVAIRGMHYHLQRLADAGLVEIARTGRGQQHRNTYRAVTKDIPGGAS